MEEQRIIKQFSSKFEEIKEGSDKNFDKFLYVKSYISTYDIDLGKDIILKGAFTESINDRISKGRNIPFLWQHNMDWQIGHAINITEDEKGIFVESRLHKSHWRVKNEIIPLLENGSLQEFSIGFGVKTKDCDYDEETGIRTIRKGILYEYSFVTLAMNPEAGLESFKSQIQNIKELKEIEKLLKYKGFSNNESKMIISKIAELKEFSKPREEEIKENIIHRDDGKKESVIEPLIDEDVILKSIEEFEILKEIDKLCQRK